VTAVQPLPSPVAVSLLCTLRARLAAFASTALALLAILVAAACTETPSYFPPCVDTAPCPDAGDDVTEAASDATAAPDAMKTADSPSDAPPEAH
jgi:hypothetical protein